MKINKKYLQKLILQEVQKQLNDGDIVESFVKAGFLLNTIHEWHNSVSLKNRQELDMKYPKQADFDEIFSPFVGKWISFYNGPQSLCGKLDSYKVHARNNPDVQFYLSDIRYVYNRGEGAASEEEGLKKGSLYLSSRIKNGRQFGFSMGVSHLIAKDQGGLSTIYLGERNGEAWSTAEWDVSDEPTSLAGDEPAGLPDFSS